MEQYDNVIRDFARAGSPRVSHASFTRVTGSRSTGLRITGLAMLLMATVSNPALSQQPGSAPIAAALNGGAPAVTAAVSGTSTPAQPATAAAMPAAAQPGAVLPPVTGQPVTGQPTASPAAANAATVPTATPEETNPFSNVKPTSDQQALKQDIPAMEQRLKRVEAQVSAIQQVQVAVPAGALSMGPGGHPVAGGAGPMDEESVELQAATFIACVNGKAMFRDSDQKPFFVDAKEASENEAVRRVGGCKH